MKKLLVAGLLLCVFTLGTYAQEKEKKEKLQRSLIGQRFPDFNVQEWIGKKPKLKGKFVLVDFWWRRGESNSCPKTHPHSFLRA